MGNVQTDKVDKGMRPMSSYTVKNNKCSLIYERKYRLTCPESPKIPKSVSLSLETLENFIFEIDRKINKNEILLVKRHFKIGFPSSIHSQLNIFIFNQQQRSKL